MNSLVSAVIPAYNSEKTIECCINSVLKQTYNNIEIIVINDGSTDNTLNILNTIAENNDKIKVYNIKNSGPSFARNYGIKKSSGEYIAFLDSDDTWYEDKIEKQVKCFQNDENISLLGCLISNKQIKIKQQYLQEIPLKKLLIKNYFYTPCVMIKRSVFDYCLFDTNRKYSEDHLLWLNIASNGFKCYRLNEVLVELYDKPIYGASGLSANLWEMEKGELQDFVFIRKKGKITQIQYLFISLFSILKFIRRYIYCKLR